MRRLWYHGRVDAMDGPMNRYEAVGVENGRIVFLGGDGEALAQSWDEITDLEGRQVLPGFSDTHMHLLHYTIVHSNLSLARVGSIEAMIRLGREEIRRSSPPYLLGMGWNQEHLSEGRMPLRQDLDQISTDIPICFQRVCAHLAVCNSAMLERLATIREQVSPEVWSKVDWERGFLREDAVRLYRQVLLQKSDGEIREMIRRGAADLNAAGITCVNTDDLHALPGVEPARLLAQFRELERAGELTVRVYEQCRLEPEELDALQPLLSDPADRTSLFRTGPLKLFQDGSLGARTAELIAGYEGEPDNHGIPIHTPEELYRRIRAAHSRRMDVAVHTIGDLALKKVCDAVERVQREDPWPQARHSIVHAQITSPALLERMKALGLQVMIQPIFIDADMEIIDQRVGAARAGESYNWKSMLELGLHVSGGSDCPVEPFDILENLRAAVTRLNRAGTRAYLPEQALTVEEGLRLFTSDAAWASRDEAVRGTLELGKLADLVVLDGDLFQTDPADFPKVKICETVLNGATVFRLA